VRAEARSNSLSKAYAGIGARDTPASVLEAMEEIGARMARSGWILRTGMSAGADQAFCRGACAAAGRVELYLPWPGFEENVRVDGPGMRLLNTPARAAYELAVRYHPDWRGLGSDERHLRARDVHQVLGEHLDQPVEIAICWTIDGSLDGSGSLAGGTGQALRVAHDHGIPVLNLARAEHLQQAMSFAADPSQRVP
jgi:hypothetical protein